ncbi:hypothetical protein Tco_1125020 [Tanacetum coccineum]|uniref:Uncharacterized protein n=1 Tax=Tanacetum coccineum TaxID=301880 RepID=A0ABQ5J989_9ASTR
MLLNSKGIEIQSLTDMFEGYFSFWYSHVAVASTMLFFQISILKIPSGLNIVDGGSQINVDLFKFLQLEGTILVIAFPDVSLIVGSLLPAKMSQLQPTSQASSQAQQSIIDAGSENCPPMLEKGSYIQWSSRFMRVITIQGDLNAIPPKERTTRIQLEYCCKDAKVMWEQVRRLMQGTELSKQDMETKLVNEFDIFKAVPGESLDLTIIDADSKKDEAGITLNDEEHDFLAEIHSDDGEEELISSCIMMAKIKEVDTNSNSEAAPSYYTDGLSEISLYETDLKILDEVAIAASAPV